MLLLFYYAQCSRVTHLLLLFLNRNSSVDDDLAIFVQPQIAAIGEGFCCAVYSKSEKCVIQYTYKIAVFIKTCMAYGEFARKFVFLL